MKPKIYDKMYNEEIKNKFLSNYKNANTQTLYRKLLSKFGAYENTVNRDLYTFTIEEVGDLLYWYAPKSRNSASTALSVIKMYRSFSVREGYTTVHLDYSRLIGENDINMFLNRKALPLSYLKSSDEFYGIVNHLENYQDAIILVLLWNGIDGFKHSEIVNLMVQDCDFDNRKILVKNENGELVREVVMSEKDMSYVKNATEELIYKKGNGKAKGKCTSRELIKNDFVLRVPVSKSHGWNSKIDAQVIDTRMKRIKEWCEKPHLSPQNIVTSRVMTYLNKIEEKSGVLTHNDFDEANRKFGINVKQLYNMKETYEMFKKDIFNK
jgi:integrase